jgi:hypothetical protein
MGIDYCEKLVELIDSKLAKSCKRRLKGRESRCLFVENNASLLSSLQVDKCRAPS